MKQNLLGQNRVISVPEVLDTRVVPQSSVNFTPWRGRIKEANGQALISKGPQACIGEVCEVRCSSGQIHEAEVVGFRDEFTLIMTVEGGGGIQRDDEVVALGHQPHIRVGPELLGRVVNACGTPIDRKGPLKLRDVVQSSRKCAEPFDRVPIDQMLTTGIRAIDAMLPIGKGQRIGIFGGSGVGKSTLLGCMTRNAEVDLIVIGLVGERGREVLEFLENSLGEEGLARAVVVVGTSDQAPLIKLRTALNATSIAEYFSAQGKQVLLILDSVTRFAMAARELGLAAGEPPTNKGYTPSVFSKMAQLVERSGRFRGGGSITAIYTVLMEGDDEQDPIVDAARSYLDGHIMLSRDLAAEGWFPSIDVLRSVSRLAGVVSKAGHQADTSAVRRQMAVFAKYEDLIRIGAYKHGTDPVLDEAIKRRASLREVMTQAVPFTSVLSDTLKALHDLALPGQI